MSSRSDDLAATYAALSKLYKNPTRNLYGAASCDEELMRKYAKPPGRTADHDCDAELCRKHEELLGMFRREQKRGDWTGGADLYFKILALLYEIDDYRGLRPSVEETLRREPSISIENFDPETGGGGEGGWRAADFNDRATRSLWKAKVLCAVANIESRRRHGRAEDLLKDLSTLEEFVMQKLHKPRPRDSKPSWTTLSFVLAAQARVARQRQDYSFVEKVLRRVVRGLDSRAAEIIEKLTELRVKSKRTPGDMIKRDELIDDLVLVRQKQTLTLFFNVGLANLQRGYLRTARFACQAARFEFRLTGHTFHRLFNDLLLISIKRAQTSQGEKQSLNVLKTRLEKLLPKLRPGEGGGGNPKLYLYGLRELAVIQLHCDHFDEVRRTLEKMEAVEPLARQWKSRIDVLRARALYRRWRQTPEESEDKQPLLQALKHSQDAFDAATGLRGGVARDKDAATLLARIRSAGREDLVDTMESLVTYGTVQLFLEEPSAAITSGEAVIELSRKDNPRLRAMGHLVLAEAYVQSKSVTKAREHLNVAKGLESQIDHKYIGDRRRAVERQLSQTLEFSGCKDFEEAKDHLLGWYILPYAKESLQQASKKSTVGRTRLTNYLMKLTESSPYYEQLKGLKMRLEKEEQEEERKKRRSGKTK